MTNEKPLDKKTVTELKADLKALGLAQTGVKAELIARIQAATQEKGGNSEATAMDAEAAPVEESAPASDAAVAEAAEQQPTAEESAASAEAPADSTPVPQTEAAIPDPVASTIVNGEVSSWK